MEYSESFLTLLHSLQLRPDLGEKSIKKHLESVLVDFDYA